MNLALLWRGAFIDAAKHWNSRGGGHQNPLGYEVLSPTGEVTPAFYVADKPDADWPKWEKGSHYEGFAWRGYTLDEKRNPTFRYMWKGAEVEESFVATGNGNKADGDPALVRTVKVTGELPANAWFRIATGSGIEKENGYYECQSGSTPFRVTADGATLAGRNLVLPAKAGTMTITYEWVQQQ
jgi:hypothetical protein